MRPVIIVFLNDLRRRLKSPLSVILMMAVPLAITLVIGGVFGRSGSVDMPRIKMLVYDADEGIAGRFIRQGFDQGRLSDMFDIQPVDSVEGEELMADGKASAFLIIPRNFTDDVLDRNPVSMTLMKNPSESFKPVIAEEAASTFAAVLDDGVYTFRDPISKVRSILEADRWPSMDDMDVILKETKAAVAQTRGYFTDSLLTLGSETSAASDDDQDQSSGFNIFSYVMSGSLMIGLLFTSNIMLKDIVRERERGTLARALASPITTSHVVAGKVLSVYAVTAAACMVLLLIGKFAFSMDLGDTGALLLHIAATILMCTGLMTFLFGTIRHERAADAIAPVFIIVLSMLGGSMISYDAFSDTMQKVGKLSPVYWANDGFRRIFLYNAGPADVLKNAAVLTAVGIFTLIPGAAFLGRGFRGRS
jgi:ABC-2 type transport system permease protein